MFGGTFDPVHIGQIAGLKKTTFASSLRFVHFGVVKTVFLRKRLHKSPDPGVDRAESSA